MRRSPRQKRWAARVRWKSLCSSCDRLKSSRPAALSSRCVCGGGGEPMSTKAVCAHVVCRGVSVRESGWDTFLNRADAANPSLCVLTGGAAVHVVPCARSRTSSRRCLQEQRRCKNCASARSAHLTSASSTTTVGASLARTWKRYAAAVDFVHDKSGCVGGGGGCGCLMWHHAAGWRITLAASSILGT